MTSLQHAYPRHALGHLLPILKSPRMSNRNNRTGRTRSPRGWPTWRAEIKTCRATRSPRGWR